MTLDPGLITSGEIEGWSFYVYRNLATVGAPSHLVGLPSAATRVSAHLSGPNGRRVVLSNYLKPHDVDDVPSAVIERVTAIIDSVPK